MLLSATWVVRGGEGRRMDMLKRRVAVLNMINKKYGSIGIGYSFRGSNGTFWVQEFTD